MNPIRFAVKLVAESVPIPVHSLTMAKKLLPVDALIAGYLQAGIQEAGLSYRQIGAATGMSINRIGIILRQEPPPATVGEIGMLAHVLGLTASDLIARAEAELRAPVDELAQRRDERATDCEPAEDPEIDESEWDASIGLRAVALTDDGQPDAYDPDEAPDTDDPA